MEESTLSPIVVNLILILIALVSAYILIWGSAHYQMITVIFGGLFSFAILFPFISPYMIDAPGGQLIISVLLSALVAIILWLPKKVGSFSFTAVNIVIVGLLFLTAMKLPSSGYLTAIIILFMVGGVLSFKLKKYVAPINTSIISALTAYHCAFNVKLTTYASELEFSEYANFNEQLKLSLMPYAMDIAGLILVLIIFIAFAIYIQKVITPTNNIQRSKHIACFFAVTALGGFVFALFTSFQYTGLNLFGISMVSWPVLVIATIILLKITSKLTLKSFGIEKSENVSLPKEIYFAIFIVLGAVIVPALTWLVVSPVNGSSIDMNFYNAFTNTHKPIWLIVKLAFTFFIFPDVLYKIVHGETFLYSQLIKLLKE